MKKTLANFTLLSLPLIFLVAQAWLIFDLPVQLPNLSEGVSDEEEWIMARNEAWSGSTLTGGLDRLVPESSGELVGIWTNSDDQKVVVPTKLTFLLLSIGIIGLAGISDRSDQNK